MVNPGQSEKIKLNFYFHTSLWCLKRFYEGLKGLKGLISIQLSEMNGSLRVNMIIIFRSSNNL